MQMENACLELDSLSYLLEACVPLGTLMERSMLQNNTLALQFSVHLFQKGCGKSEAKKRHTDFPFNGTAST